MKLLWTHGTGDRSTDDNRVDEMMNTKCKSNFDGNPYRLCFDWGWLTLTHRQPKRRSCTHLVTMTSATASPHLDYKFNKNHLMISLLLDIFLFFYSMHDAFHQRWREISMRRFEFICVAASDSSDAIPIKHDIFIYVFRYVCLLACLHVALFSRLFSECVCVLFLFVFFFAQFSYAMEQETTWKISTFLISINLSDCETF